MSRRETENVKIRKSYYGFSKNYPGKLGSSRYIIGDSLAVRRRETIRRVIIAVLIMLLFAVSFTVTSVCIKISQRPIESTSPQVTEQPVNNIKYK